MAREMRAVVPIIARLVLAYSASTPGETSSTKATATRAGETRIRSGKSPLALIAHQATTSAAKGSRILNFAATCRRPVPLEAGATRFAVAEGSVAAIMLGEPRGSRLRIADQGRAPRAPDEAPARRCAASRGRS